MGKTFIITRQKKKKKKNLGFAANNGFKRVYLEFSSSTKSFLLRNYTSWGLYGNLVSFKIKNWDAGTCIGGFCTSDCSVLSKTRQENWTRKVFCLRQGQMLTWKHWKIFTITLYAEQKKRHRCTEQSFRLCGRRRGWDVSREQHWNMYII